MAKIQIKSEKLTPFGGIFSIMEQFDALLAQTIDSTLGLRCTMFGYQYSEILRSLMCVYLCGGSCIEDVTTHLMKHLSLHPTLRTCSADTILRAIEELTFKSITYKSASGKSYDFNTADKMNCLLVNALLATGQLKSGQEYDFDFDHQFIETEKYDAKPTYKKFLGYSPGVAVINDMIVGIEKRRQHKRTLQPKRNFGKNLQAIGGFGNIYFSCPHGLRLMFGGNRRYGRGSLQAFLYSCQQMLFFLRFHVCLNWMENC